MPANGRRDLIRRVKFNKFLTVMEPHLFVNSVQALLNQFQQRHFNIILPTTLCLPSNRFLNNFSAETLYPFITFPMHAT